MKKLFIILYLLTNIFVLGACGDVESEGDPQPRVPRVEVESDDYYVQITQENMDGVAFVYRWLDIETASKYVMTLGLQVDGEITETMGVEDKSILTYNGVREQLFTNQQIMEYMKAFGVDEKRSSVSHYIGSVSVGWYANTSEMDKESKTSIIHIVLGPGVELNSSME